ncbi:MAG TPA: TetR/AcrR family transcriptional regulator [Oscillospiraceae bacterium]|nr:TetR/AcrR family transcriptional regulator [Oscillospiraceae bacterium]
MGKSEEIKEKIMAATIDMLEKSNGKIENITIRGIAQTVGIGTGLINYHFGTKENLIEQCVQRIIQDVITVFKPQMQKGLDETGRLKETAKQVMDFLAKNPEISKISILGDMVNPMILDNTTKTVMGFLTVMEPEKKQAKLLTYCFTLILQGLFLRKEITKNTVGFDFNCKAERDTFIDFIVDRMYGGISHENANAERITAQRQHLVGNVCNT